MTRRDLGSVTVSAPSPRPGLLFELIIIPVAFCLSYCPLRACFPRASISMPPVGLVQCPEFVLLVRCWILRFLSQSLQDIWGS